MKKYLLPLLSILLISIGCYKDVDNTPPSEIIIEITEVLVNTSISGSVFDLDGNYLTNYNLLVNNQLNNIPSDYFLLQMEDLKKKGQTIHVFKDDQQIGIRTQLLVENDINHMEIHQHSPIQTTALSSNDQEIELSKTIKANFSSTQWENDYQGEINVEHVLINSTNSLTPVGYSSLSDLLAVDSRGGFYLSVKNDTDEPLKAKNDFPIIIQTADLSSDINSIFKFDKENELWILIAEISSGDEINIQGEGYYTFANYSPGVFVEGVVKKEERPVAYQPMVWDLVSMSNQLCATEKGRWIGLLPEDEDVVVNLLNPCNESLQTETLEIEINDILDQNLIIENGDNYQLMDFTILDCEGNVVSSPNVSIDNGNGSVNYVFSEEFPDRWMAVCDEFEIAAVDETTGANGPGLSWNTTISGSLDVLTDCADFDQGYSFIKVRDEMKVYPVFEIEVENQRTILKSEDGNVKFIFKGQEERMYNVDEVNVLIDDADLGYYIKCEQSILGCGMDHFNVTHYETSENGMMRAEFSGTMWMQQLSPSVAGNYEVEGVIVIKL